MMRLGKNGKMLRCKAEEACDSRLLTLFSVIAITTSFDSTTNVSTLHC